VGSCGIDGFLTLGEDGCSQIPACGDLGKVSLIWTTRTTTGSNVE
jgi:hypothetical protein